MKQIIQIVPRVPPAMCGVGDYSWLLANELEARHGIQSQFIFTDALAPDAPANARFKSFRCPAGDAARLARLVGSSDAQAVVLQLSGYGYAANGAPFWLGRALRAIRDLPRRPRVITMFHELYASGPVTSKAFWRRLPQQMALRRIIQLSDCLRTNRRAYADWIFRHSTAEVITMPVFSNLGEAANPVPPVKRENRMVLFQPPCARSTGGRGFWETWKHVQSTLHPSSSVAAGRSGEFPAGAQIEKAGVLSAAEVSRLMAGSRYVFVDYYDGYLAKSGIFAAAAAHGMTCILAKRNHSEADGIREGVHYVTAMNAGKLLDKSRLDACSNALWLWYQDHSIRATADSFATQILV